MSIWEFLVYVFWFYIWFTCLIIFFTVFFDVFRDSSLNGWAKTGWVIFFVLVPFLAALIYLIARGESMRARRSAEVQAAQADNASYIQSVAGRSSVDDIATAKGLLDSGAITQPEFDKIKASALASVN